MFPNKQNKLFISDRKIVLSMFQQSSGRVWRAIIFLNLLAAFLLEGQLSVLSASLPHWSCHVPCLRHCAGTWETASFPLPHQSDSGYLSPSIFPHYSLHFTIFSPCIQVLVRKCKASSLGTAPTWTDPPPPASERYL